MQAQNLLRLNSALTVNCQKPVLAILGGMMNPDFDGGFLSIDKNDRDVSTWSMSVSRLSSEARAMVCFKRMLINDGEDR
ncbi:unnamed protein product, partial [Clonostachys rhizophaga]